MSEQLLIIGCGMATVRLLEELVARNYPGKITVIGEEPDAGYNRILLSSLLCGDKEANDLPLVDEDWYERQGITLFTGDKVARIDLEASVAFTASGLQVAFDRLVFATGSRAHLPAIPGIDADGVMGFRTLGDLRILQQKMKPGDRAVVIGGGLLGLEAAHGLNVMGMDVTVIHRQPYVMNRQLDNPAGDLLAAQLRKRGIGFRLSVTPEAVIENKGRVTSVRLAGGEILPASVVLFAAGIDLNCELASESGLACERGILVDSHMTTSDPRCSALGECCQLGDITFGLVAPVWEQAEVLAARLMGEENANYQYRDAPTQLKVSGIDLYSAGDINGHKAQDQVLRDDSRGVYRRLFLENGRLKGAVLLGDRRDGNWYRELIETGKDVAAYQPWLLFGRDYCEAQVS